MQTPEQPRVSAVPASDASEEKKTKPTDWFRIRGSTTHQYQTLDNKKIPDDAAGDFIVPALRRMDKSEPEKALLTLRSTKDECQLVKDGPFMPVMQCEIQNVASSKNIKYQAWLLDRRLCQPSLKLVSALVSVRPIVDPLSEDEEKLARERLKAGMTKRSKGKTSKAQKLIQQRHELQLDSESDSDDGSALEVSTRQSPRPTRELKALASGSRKRQREDSPMPAAKYHCTTPRRRGGKPSASFEEIGRAHV